MEQMLYLLTDETDPDKIRNAVLKNFGVSTEENSFSLNFQNYRIDMMILAKDMGEEDAAKAKEQINAIAGRVYHIETDFTDVKTNLVTYLLWMKSIVMIRCSSEQASDEVTQEIIGTVLKSSDEIDVLMFSPGNEEEQDEILGFDSDGELRCILSEEGESDIEEYMPPRKPCPFTDAPQEQRDRRAKTMEVLDENCIMLPTYYPFVETEENSNCRSLDEVLHRTLALLIISLYAEVLMGENLDTKKGHEFVSKVMSVYGVTEDWLSPKELEFFNDEDPSEDEATNYTWQYENLYICEWALGLQEMDFPDHYCDVAGIVSTINEYNSYEELKNACTLRSAAELLDEDDLIFCLDWSCVDNRIHRLPSVAEMDPGVVFERHKTLDWLVGADDSADWDEVQPNT